MERGLLLLLCVTCNSSLEGNYFARVKSARVSPKTLKVPTLPYHTASEKLFACDCEACIYYVTASFGF